MIRDKKRGKKIRLYLIIVFASLLIFLVLVTHYSAFDLYSDHNTIEYTGITTDIKTEQYMTGYKTRKSTKICLSLDNEKEYYGEFLWQIKG